MHADLSVDKANRQTTFFLEDMTSGDYMPQRTVDWPSWVQSCACSNAEFIQEKQGFISDRMVTFSGEQFTDTRVWWIGTNDFGEGAVGVPQHAAYQIWLGNQEEAYPTAISGGNFPVVTGYDS